MLFSPLFDEFGCPLEIIGIGGVELEVGSQFKKNLDKSFIIENRIT